MSNSYERNRQFYEITESLEKHHSIFYAICDLGYPVFDDTIPTACVKFDDVGKCVQFCFNPDFWDKLDEYNRAFVICHECLHVILDHGKRISDTDNPQLCNYALDIVVNHTLVNKFNFIRDKILNWNDFCWIDTLFKNPETIDKDRNFEYYYKQLSSNMNSNVKVITFDVHEFLKSFAGSGKGGGKDTPGDGSRGGVDELISESVGGKVSKDEIKDFINKMDSCDKDAGFGKGRPGEPLVAGNLVALCQKLSQPYKKKWETIIKTWESRTIEYSDQEQWTHRPRRMAVLSDELMLPSEYEVEGYSKNKLDVFFYLDNSGSCWHLKNRFFAAAKSLNPKKFNVRLFSRTTVVKEITEDTNMYGGGSDDFRCIEKHIQTEIKEGKIPKYPAAVFHITDGYDCSGVLVKPEKPKRWYTFLSDSSTTEWLPKDSNIYYLKDFE